MNKRLRNTKTTQSFSDFTSKLSAKWRLLTLPARPAQPKGGREEMEEIFRQLVAIPTITGNHEANHDALDYIERFLKKRGMHVSRLEWNGIESLIATTRKTKTPKVMLSAHLDVVHGDQELFELREEDGKYFGRGVLDMKYAIAAYMQAADELKHQLHAYDFGIMITTDEEAGGLDGVAKFADNGYIPEVLILPDGGMNWQIQLYSKGFLYLSIASKGRPAHGSRPWLGENAIDKLMATLTDIHTLFPDPGTDPDTTHNTINIGQVSGGNTVNQVAGSAEALLDIRYASSAERERLLADMNRICAAHGTKLQVVIQGESTNFSLSDPYFAALAKIITDVTGKEVKGSRTPASSDIRYYIPHGVPCISVYPPGGGHHGREEWIDKEGFHQFKDVIVGYVKAVGARTPVKKSIVKQSQ